MKTVNDVRKTYLNFFEGKGHTVVPSSSLVPHNDPTLMFSNAGMNQFKDVFTGRETPPYTRATSSQKCVRAGGKHNDLENVGYTLRHHTFFEMLGNFSFGDYFKEEAIAYAWELLTKDFGLPKEKLLATIYHTDDEAFDLWKKIAGLPDERIIRIPTDDNFWSMGDTGPCGPSSEIFYDHGPDVPGGPPGSPDEDGDRFIEIWNLVFMQYDQQADGSRIELPKPCIDTGMGLERMATLLITGGNDNYKTDIFQNLIGEIAEYTGTPHDKGEERFSQRVIADHLRTSSFLMADGVLPSNEGRGYVLRRIMRRAMRHAHILGAKEPLMHRLVASLENSMADAYPQLTQARALITETLKNEETRFKELLANGLKLLDAETSSMGEGDALSGTVAFKLYDTYGFPLDLTQDVLKNRKIDVNEGEFKAAMEEQRAKARAAWSGSGESANEKIWFDVKEKAGATDFLGYDSVQSSAVVKALVMDGAMIAQAKKGQNIAFVTNQTPFYGESGGQVGDTGTAKTTSGGVLRISDTKKFFGDVIVHHAMVEEGTIAEGDEITLIVDEVRRAAIRGHHSATHLLHEAMRQRLGDHIAQKGSLVAHDRLRFDVSQPTAPSKEDLQAIENAVNAKVQANTPVETRVLPIDQAMECGARALFGEKYDDEVRVVSMGMPDTQGKRPYAVELCGGTHVKSTGEIGLFKIVSEGSVSSGVRRIEALTGQAALDYMRGLEKTIQECADALKAAPEELPSRIEALLADRKAQEKEIAKLRKQLATGGGGASDDIETINGIKFIGKVLDGIPPKDLKPMADELKKKVGSGVITLVSTFDNKASVVTSVTSDLLSSYNAIDLLKPAITSIGGKGCGGRPDMAQGGGTKTDHESTNAVLTMIAGQIKEKE